ncbi:MAG: UTP--glucose-1-phosphate uridylyltransferase [Pantoea sp. Brub]|nr:UTP--glucose-1-phosphate uridylyltransferase [Pantoea sp. Brub]
MFNDKFKVKQAIIPAAGLGIRMSPVTKIIPKEMLPLVDKPIIEYILRECILSGINDIILVTHPSKHCINNYFNIDHSDKQIKQNIKFQLLANSESTISANITIIQIPENNIKGIGYAIMCAYPLIGNKPIAIILPDVIIDEYKSNLNKTNLAAMLIRYEKTGCSQIMVKSVSDVTAYGIVDCKGVELNPGEYAKIIGVIEKPKSHETLSKMAIVGRYVLSADIWQIIQNTPLGKDNEMQLTDSINILIGKRSVEAYYLEGVSYDCGNKLGYMKAFVEYGIHHADLGKYFSQWLYNLFFQNNN